MANTDACKIQVTEFVKKLTEKGMSVNAACKEVQRESDGIPAETIRRWWKEIKTATAEKLVINDQPTITSCNSPEIQDNQVTEPKHGGKREGTGAPQKYEAPPQIHSNAMHFAIIAVSQLSRITDDDPKKFKALKHIQDWIDNKYKEWSNND